MGPAPLRPRGGEGLALGLPAERDRRPGDVRGGEESSGAQPRSFPAGGRRPELRPAPGEAGAAPLAPGGEGLAGRRVGGKKPAGREADCSQLGCESLGFPQPQRTPGFGTGKLGFACV